MTSPAQGLARCRLDELGAHRAVLRADRHRDPLRRAALGVLPRADGLQRDAGVGLEVGEEQPLGRPAVLHPGGAGVVGEGGSGRRGGVDELRSWGPPAAGIQAGLPPSGEHNE